MKHKLGAYVSRLIISVAFLAFLVASGTFIHAVDSHTDHVHQGESAQDTPHSHPEIQRFAAIDFETVHCGANLLALTSEIRTEIPSVDEAPDPLGSKNLVSEVKAVDPPPPRSVS